jgi:hypothetical protein
MSTLLLILLGLMALLTCQVAGEFVSVKDGFVYDRRDCSYLMFSGHDYCQYSAECATEASNTLLHFARQQLEWRRAFWDLKSSEDKAIKTMLVLAHRQNLVKSVQNPRTCKMTDARKVAEIEAKLRSNLAALDFGIFNVTFTMNYNPGPLFRVTEGYGHGITWDRDYLPPYPSDIEARPICDSSVWFQGKCKTAHDVQTMRPTLTFDDDDSVFF